MIFPNVPNVPGVPPIPRSPQFPPAIQGALGIAETFALGILFPKPVWGIYDQSGGAQVGKLLTPVDSFLDIERHLESKITDAPVEKGGFASYNKVNLPYEAKVRIAKGGTDAERLAFMRALSGACKSTTLYDIYMPEALYSSCNIVEYNLARTVTNGTELLVAELTLRQVVQVTPAYSTVQNAQNPASASPANAGKVQPAPPAASALSQLAGAAQAGAKYLSSFFGG